MHFWQSQRSILLVNESPLFPRHILFLNLLHCTELFGFFAFLLFQDVLTCQVNIVSIMIHIMYIFRVPDGTYLLKSVIISLDFVGQEFFHQGSRKTSLILLFLFWVLEGRGCPHKHIASYLRWKSPDKL